jgi:hypothetical protein
MPGSFDTSWDGLLSFHFHTRGLTDTGCFQKTFLITIFSSTSEVIIKIIIIIIAFINFRNDTLIFQFSGHCFVEHNTSSQTWTYIIGWQ